MKQLSIVLFIVVVVDQLAWTTAEVATKAPNKIRDLAVKFELFGRDPSQESTGIAYDELEEAYKDYKSRLTHPGGEEFFAGVREKSSMFRLLDDLVLTPMKYWRLSPLEDDTTKEVYMKLVETFFRRFWPAYVERKLIGGKFLHKAKKFLRFLAAFEGSSQEKPSVRMWQLAHGEYTALEQKTRELVANEDIYVEATQFGLLLNFFNDARVSSLKENFFDRLDSCGTDNQLLELQAEYRKIKF